MFGRLKYELQMIMFHEVVYWVSRIESAVISERKSGLGFMVSRAGIHGGEVEVGSGSRRRHLSDMGDEPVSKGNMELGLHLAWGGGDGREMACFCA